MSYHLKSCCVENLRDFQKGFTSILNNQREQVKHFELTVACEFCGDEYRYKIGDIDYWEPVKGGAE